MHHKKIRRQQLTYGEQLTSEATFRTNECVLEGSKGIFGILTYGTYFKGPIALLNIIGGSLEIRLKVSWSIEEDKRTNNCT
jgi:hypothetical protein